MRLGCEPSLTPFEAHVRDKVWVVEIARPRVALPHTFFGRGPIFWKQRFGVVGQRIEVEV